MNFHSASQLFPLMEGEDFDALVEDIRRHGLRERIVLLDGDVLDGRNRLRACESAEVEPVFRDVDLGEQTPTEYVLSENLHRRHLTTSQRAAIAVEALPMFEAEAKERQGARSDLIANSQGSWTEPPSVKSAADTVGVGQRIVSEAKAVKEQSPELFEDIKAGRVKVHTAAKTLGRKSGGHRRSSATLDEVLSPLHKWLKDWDEDRLKTISPAQARKLLVKASETREALFELERALSDKTVVSRALR